MNDLHLRLKRLYPAANLDPFNGSKVLLQDDGTSDGPYIARWDDSLGPRPTLEQLLAVDVTPTMAERISPEQARQLVDRGLLGDFTPEQQTDIQALAAKADEELIRRARGEPV